MKEPKVSVRQIAGSLISGYILLGAVLEVYSLRADITIWLGKYSISWWMLLLALGALFVSAGIGAILILWTPQFKYITAPILKVRQRLNWLRWPFAFVMVLIPAILLSYNQFGRVFSTAHFRLLLLLAASAGFAFFLTRSNTVPVGYTNFLFGITLTGAIHISVVNLKSVTSYPFSLFWSEGNRLYDYSVLLGSARYNYSGKLSLPYDAPGRYLLWGLPFIFTQTPIWLHRLWNAFLATVPHILFGYSLTRWSRFNQVQKWFFAFWVFLFLAQGPIYTTLLLSALIVAAFTKSRNWLITAISVAIAGYFAAASRWTWLPAPAIWATLILLSEFQLTAGEHWLKTTRRLAPIAGIALAGLLGGALANPQFLMPGQMSGDIAFSQPLLWQRLLPNPTFAPGILIALAFAAGPLIILMIWMAATKRWQLNWLQYLAYVLSSLAFLALGLVASVKIGGGNNLHNLDMFLINLALLSGLMVRNRDRLISNKWPFSIQGLLLLLAILPAWSAIKIGSPLELPSKNTVIQVLETIDAKTHKAMEIGEVLFIDQRQLLTFGYINDIPLVPEYEKKYLMNQAMAGNSVYFEDFYTDIANQRFSLIVSEVLFTNEQNDSRNFFEENAAWIRWVARPLLCYYVPIATFRELNIQLLAPRSDPSGCP